MFNQELSEYRQEHVRPVMLEFEAAAGRRGWTIKRDDLDLYVKKL
jgi:hypothetical protein